jgi:large subunit GTPase 1
VEIGLTGYPNVGKSSVINTVLGKKKVGVASMPGKTKHFQTLKLTEAVTLCDCPGLVFPKISESKAEMVLCGLYPIDIVKEYEEPLELIAYRVEKSKIEALYALHWKADEPYDGESILVKYAKLKGFYTGSGLPSQAQAARHILKDYVNGVLVYNHPPPHSQEEALSFEQRQAQIEQEKLNFEKKEEQVEQHLDLGFFEKEEGKERSAEDVVAGLGEDDLLDIIEGKRVEGLKITKEMRKEIKFAMKRGAKLDDIRKLLLGSAAYEHKTLIKV